MDKLYATSFVSGIQDTDRNLISDKFQNSVIESTKVFIPCTITNCKKLFKYTYHYRFNILLLTI